jgi:hypothetical protein
MKLLHSPSLPPSAGFGAFIGTGRAISRRHFLRGAGVAISLPLLESMLPAFTSVSKQKGRQKPKRILAICNNLGLLSEHFFPQQQGGNYVPSHYLSRLGAHRDDFTVFSGVSHPGVDGGHPADICFLTAAPHPGSGGFRNTISLDQFVAERIGTQTRFSSLTLGVNVLQGWRSLSWTGSGSMIPCEENPAEVFNRLFLQGRADEVESELRKLSLGHSILDAVRRQIKTLEGSVGPRDRDRLDQYFTSVRELEQQIDSAREWARRPKPRINVAAPINSVSPREYMAKVKLMYDLSRLAFETDSTRAISLLLDGVNSPAIAIENETITDGYHNLSHHGKSDQKLAQLRAIDEWHMKLLGELLASLKATRDDGTSLLENTMVLYGSNLGNAATHSTLNLPVILAGGGFRHGQHLAFDTANNYPLANLFVTMLQRMNIEVDAFASGRGPMRGFA